MLCQANVHLVIYESDQSYHMDAFFVCNDSKFVTPHVSGIKSDTLIDAIDSQRNAQRRPKKRDQRQATLVKADFGLTSS